MSQRVQQPKHKGSSSVGLKVKQRELEKSTCNTDAVTQYQRDKKQAGKIQIAFPYAMLCCCLFQIQGDSVKLWHAVMGRHIYPSTDTAVNDGHRREGCRSPHLTSPPTTRAQQTHTAYTEKGDDRHNLVIQMCIHTQINTQSCFAVTSVCFLAEMSV